jgi:hypothetical protein
MGHAVRVLLKSDIIDTAVGSFSCALGASLCAGTQAAPFLIPAQVATIRDVGAVGSRLPAAPLLASPTTTQQGSLSLSWAMPPEDPL